MKDKHYNGQFSAYLNHEMPQDERQQVAEHLLACALCRKEHDEIKFGVALASRLEGSDAPAHLWSEIESSLIGPLKGNVDPSNGLVPQLSFFNLRGILATAAALIVVCGLIAAVYFNLFKAGPDTVVKKTGEINQNVAPAFAHSPSAPNQNSNVGINTRTNSNSQIPQNSNSNTPAPDAPPNTPQESTAETAAWSVETLAGMPKIENSSVTDKLAVGEVLETDANSRAKIKVADIGDVVIAPNSRVKLIRTQSTEHRLSLERGVLQAKILAPPRLFIVDTPSAVAVDLGCAYTLEVDAAGNSKLHVTAGYVALERGGREAIVPAAAICLTKKGKGVGTPFFETVSPAYQKALWQIDFENGGAAPLQTIINESRAYDSLSLWHLLSRVKQQADREKVFEKLVAFAPLPDGVTKPGVLSLDKKMLDEWREAMADLWFEDVL